MHHNNYSNQLESMEWLKKLKVSFSFKAPQLLEKVSKLKNLESKQLKINVELDNQRANSACYNIKKSGVGKNKGIFRCDTMQQISRFKKQKRKIKIKRGIIFRIGCRYLAKCLSSN